MNQHRTVTTGDEQDAYAPNGRRAHGYLRRPGVVKAIKRRTHRRERREARAEIRDLRD